MAGSYDRDYDRDRDRERDRDRDYDRDRDRDRDLDRDRDRDRDYDRDVRRDGPSDDYSDDRQIRDEGDRLRREINQLKDALESRRAENADLKATIRQAEKNNVELLNAIIESLNNIGTKVDGMDGDMGSSIKKSLSSLKDDLDEINLPVAAKCEAIESRLKTLQENLDYGEPMKEKMEAATEGMKEALAEKFGSKTIGDVLQKLASINTFLIADSIGIVVLLALMCFFIISLIK